MERGLAALTNDDVGVLCAFLDHIESIKVPKHNFNIWISRFEFRGWRTQESCSSNVWKFLEDSFQGAASNIPSGTSSRINQLYSSLGNNIVDLHKQFVGRHGAVQVLLLVSLDYLLSGLLLSLLSSRCGQ